MTLVSVVVPWRGGCPHRETAWRWVRARYAEHHPDWELVVGHGSEPWVKAEAVLDGLHKVHGDVLVVADADCWADNIEDAVNAVHDGAPWAIPHTLVHRLTRTATEVLLDGADPYNLNVEQEPYRGVPTGGIVAIGRTVAYDVPMDCRFAGWGGEDHSWGYALGTLHGDPWRGPAPLWHLWHPHPNRVTRLVGSYPSEQLRRRYFAVLNDRPAMRQLVEQGRGAWPNSPSTAPVSPGS